MVEEYSGRNITNLADRIPAFFQIASRYSSTPGNHCGQFLAGLWLNDLLRGLLWRVEGGRKYWRKDGYYIAPSWSWAAVLGRVRHVWPRDTTPLAIILDVAVAPISENLYRRVITGYLKLRSLLVEFKPVGMTWSAWTGDIEVEVLAEDEHKEVLRIRYTLDNFNPETPREAQLYGTRITRRIGLLLIDSGEGNGNVKRVGLFIVAKPDTLRWMAITGERDVTII